MIRQPIVVVMGHVDCGKTSLLDTIRKTSVQAREAAGMTQHIGASEVPLSVIKQISGDLLDKFKVNLTIPGILFVDTPGHEVFTNLRKRGGSIADIAILVVDICAGIQSQTLESIEIMKSYKTPFVIAANKIDMLPNWISSPFSSILPKLLNPDSSITKLDDFIYKLIGQLYEHGFSSERFDRVSDFTKQLVIVPVSAKTGEGIPDLLTVLAGLTQKYMEKRLEIDPNSGGKGSIIEVKEETGLGTTLNTILFDGHISVSDTIVFGTLNGAVATKVRALLKPKPLNEMRDPEDRFISVKEAYAATGVKICAPNLEGAIPGSPIVVVSKEGDVECEKSQIGLELSNILISTEGPGVIIKADTLGSIEALSNLLKEKNIPIRKADIGMLSKRDLMEAQAVKRTENDLGVIFCFNVSIAPDLIEEAENLGIPIIKSDIIYHLIDQYNEWLKAEREKEKTLALSSLVFPGKIQFLPGCCFRASKPAIIGVKVLEGRIKPNYDVININGKKIGKIKEIQSNNVSVAEATKGMEVAISLEGPTVGRQINEGEIIYTNPSKEHIKILITKYKEILTNEEIELLKEIQKLQGEPLAYF